MNTLQPKFYFYQFVKTLTRFPLHSKLYGRGGADGKLCCLRNAKK